MKCTGHSSRTGKPCKRDAIAGGNVCLSHGGSAGQVKAKAKDRLERAAAAAAIKTLGLDALGEFEELDPRDVLAQELWRTHATERLLRELVNDLKLGADGIYGHTFHVSGIATGEAKPHVLWVMWQDERRHLKTVAAEAHRAGLEVRRQQLAEQTAGVIVQLIRETLADPALDLTAAQQKTGQTVAAGKLRLVS